MRLDCCRNHQRLILDMQLLVCAALESERHTKMFFLESCQMSLQLCQCQLQIKVKHKNRFES